ncbi:hypothetical protein G6L68_25455 [Agrobacterium fabrum]|uniref:putative Ig domain-containing protein n=1 Tax=Agrobacterium fabrum TaxID=1176649 RepID=UPI000EF5B962|nr:putative Ig domain-containing protein [Agrobacterium fabrum]AYM66134.1 hypothetical protein At12D13_49820 [Agrobacterium fabrum]NTE63982.1 hypothetical protein [Agrobacterium fabrum]
MRHLAILLIAATSSYAAHAADLTFMWRAPGTGILMTKTVTIPAPVDPGQPEQPQGFRVSISGTQAVAYASAVNLVPIVEDGVGPFVFSHFGPLPVGVTFNNATGRFSGVAHKRGTFAITIEVLDTGTGQSTGTGINIVVS